MLPLRPCIPLLSRHASISPTGVIPDGATISDSSRPHSPRSTSAFHSFRMGSAISEALFVTNPSAQALRMSWARTQ